MQRARGQLESQRGEDPLWVLPKGKVSQGDMPHNAVSGGGYSAVPTDERDSHVISPRQQSDSAANQPPPGGRTGGDPSHDLAGSPKSQVDVFLDLLPPQVKFGVLVLCVFVFFCCHNYLQEGLTRMDGFQGLGSMLGYLEVFGMVFFTFLERYSTGDREQRVPSFAYGQLTLCLLGTSYLSTVGLDLINYPTKVVLRSCKLIPTMAVAIVLHRESFSMSEMASAVAICTGLALFAFADMSGSTKASTFLGLALQAGSVVADAFLPNLQQRLFKRGASAVEVTFFTNLYVFVIMTLMGGGSGHIAGMVRFGSQSSSGLFMMVLYTFAAYLAISAHMRIVKGYGSVVAVLVGNMRKAGTIYLSFIMFPKPFSWLYVVGSLFVLGGLSTVAYVKDKRRKAKDAAAAAGGGVSLSPRK